MRAFIVAPATPLQARKVATSSSMPRFTKIAFVASETEEAQAARAELIARYGDASADNADAIVALGGDGLMLQTMHRHLRSRIPIYGMNRGSVGFLLNDYHENDLMARLENAEVTIIHPLLMTVQDVHGHARRARHQRGVAVPADLPGGQAQDRGGRQGAHGRANLRRRARIDARRQWKLSAACGLAPNSCPFWLF